MPRYHFNLRATGSHVSDGEGMVLLDDDAAVVRARQIVREIVATEVRDDGVVMLAQSIDVLTERGDRLSSVAFDEVIRVVRE